MVQNIYLFGKWHMSWLMASPSMWWWEIHIGMSTCAAAKRKSTTETWKSVWVLYLEFNLSQMCFNFDAKTHCCFKWSFSFQVDTPWLKCRPILHKLVGTVAPKITFAHDGIHHINAWKQSINMFPATWTFAQEGRGFWCRKCLQRTGLKARGYCGLRV